MITAKMKILLALAVWIFLSEKVHSHGIGFGIKKEIFFLNLEDGYFGCQVNESTDFLQLYELSRLCDGKHDCYRGSDELRRELKCSNDCGHESGIECQNGACLDHQCHCNDGFGGCSCEVPDENECKNRPCDVFAHCTNTLGSFHCSCFPGYTGDGFHCQDINECDDPVLASRCVPNAECCNLPAHYLCRCLPGFQGDGEEECVDIDECQHADACGVNAICHNIPGNYTCDCLQGYEGNPYNGCADIDECSYPGACAPGAVCKNSEGGYLCACPPGTTGDPVQGNCIDVDECLGAPCGPGAICANIPGSYVCSCPPGFAGDPYRQCEDMDECSSSPCGKGAKCENLVGNFSCVCPTGYSGDPKISCTDINECARPNACGVNAQCSNTEGSFTCSCPGGFSGDPHVFCQNTNECEQDPCGENAICKDTEGGYTCSCKDDYTGDPYKGCIDLNECEVLERPCGANAVCENTEPGYNCLCPQGFEPRPNSSVLCEQVDVTVLCRSKFDCVNNAECIEGQCFCQNGFKATGSVCLDIDECLKETCGPNSVCTNTPGNYSCDCLSGYVGNPPRIQCKEPCEEVKCGPHAFCKSEGHEAYCICEEGWNYNPVDISAGCIDINECDKSNGPFGNCGENAICENNPGSFSCQCKPGFSGNPFHQCTDINECEIGSCGLGAICENTIGSFKCKCPPDTIPDPDPFNRCVSIVTCSKDSDCPGNAVCDDQDRCFCPEPNIGNDCRHPCEGISCQPNAECMLIEGEGQCICKAGYTGGSQGCIDIDECQSQVCGQGSVCRNEPGGYTCQCPGGSSGDPYREGCSRPRVPFSCSADKPCPGSEICIQEDGLLEENVCVCQQGYRRDVNGICSDINECLESKEKPACGLNAVCKNLPGSYECKCPDGFNGNPYMVCEECNTLECRCRPPYKVVNGDCVLSECSSDSKCPSGAECISITGGVSYCACPKGMEQNEDGTCKDVNECLTVGICGYGAKCINLHGSFKCLCPDGYFGDPYRACAPNQMKCSIDSDCQPNEKCIQPGECVCPPPYFTDITDNNKCKSPCDRFPCGLNAKCTPSDPPKCLCSAGFKGDPFKGCIDEDECLKNPCGLRAHCINEKGSYKCICPIGTSGDPYRLGCTESSAKTECTTDNDCAGQLACMHGNCINPCNSLPCGKNAYCEPENHAAWCRCAVGFIESPNGDCVSPCSGFICGKGAQCIVTSTGPTCKCAEGTRGNPFAGGECSQDICSLSKPCPPRYTCISGRCREKCHGVICGLGANCDPTTNQCVCNPLFIGNPDLVCMPPVAVPMCVPACGKNAHCSYGINENICMCNPGTSGNPYDECKAQELVQTCTKSTCGKGAFCRQDINSIECLCPPGYKGNPYVECQDINECIGEACGGNAICINTPGSYDCQCKEGYIGNPFSNCMRLAPQGCQDPLTCSCSKNNPCPTEYTCKRGRCKNQCEGVKCGPRAACVSGKCVCPPGLSGNPNDLKKGCQIQGQCTNDFDCKNNEICFQQGKGFRQCLDACKKIQCGPNALCVSDKHRSSCICADGYDGVPSDLTLGCQKERAVPREECKNNDDCSSGRICVMNLEGMKICIDKCWNIACGVNEECFVDEKGNAACKCKDNYIRNPIHSICEKPSLPECESDNHCKDKEACSPDPLGISKCLDVCLGFTCPVNAKCVSSNHKGFCQCLVGYTGNPNDRNGCVPALKDTCSQDSQCMETEKCKKGRNGAMSCRLACEDVRCGAGAICVANNHVGQCQCPPGPYLGDPATTGCKQVHCVFNTDCPHHQLCDRLSNRCYDVCENYKCGDNAVCIGEAHRAVCQCPPGFKPKPVPEIECESVDICEVNPCHPSAICEPAPSVGYRCKCPPNTVGDPISGGCITEGSCPNGDNDCPESSICQNGRCVDPCEQACGINAICTVINKKPVCSCPPKFQLASTETRSPCIRTASQCVTDSDCFGDICLNNECRAICRSTNDCLVGERCIQNKCLMPCVSHSQCLEAQACVNGLCMIGCRSNKDCSYETACIHNKCQDPCKTERACGDNALCSVENHTTICHCPVGFIGNPDQGCIRKLGNCLISEDCLEGQICINGDCQVQCSANHGCATGERCSDGICVKICFAASNCLPGQLCINAICKPGCTSDSDCSNNQVCLNNRCKCSSGYVFGGNTCQDLDECLENPCHPTAKCDNTLGSFKCTCENGHVGDPYSEPGCIAPDHCQNDDNCHESLICHEGKCTDPCHLTKEGPCGPKALCQVHGHSLTCSCPQGYLGDPHDPNIGCFKVECISSEDCPTDKFCDNQAYKCMNPCDVTNCGPGTCKAENHKGLCECFVGFALLENKCIDDDECIRKPCHPSAVCINTVGSYSCACESGLIGDAIHGGCRKPGECNENSDCPLTAACIENTCRDPCINENVCGKQAICKTSNHIPICSCPVRTTGDPKIKCSQLECSEHTDCAETLACFSGHCVDPCKIDNVCGSNTECFAANHDAVCSCKPGTTGDPHLGCVQLQYCSTNSQCQAGTVCHNGICLSVCSSSRECISDQLCISNVCQPTCHSNSSCPDFQYCQNNICLRELKCEKDSECEDHQRCITNSIGQAICENVCESSILCGRNAECTAKNHQPICNCKPGYHGNPLIGCHQIECRTNLDCSDDKMCEDYMCKISCLVKNPCGQNALCSAESHKQVCYCQPGFSGNAYQGCTIVDYCESNPCGPGASCANSRGSYKCLCPIGTVGDPYKEGCFSPVECTVNEDCPNAAICVVSDGHPKCRDVCETIKCGPNADCMAKKHDAVCSCNADYEGNPNDLIVGCRPRPIQCNSNNDCPYNTRCHGNLCRSSCRSHSECNLEEQCLLGHCTNPCLDNSACGLNAQCNIVDHQKHCSCPAGFTGNELIECVRVPISCHVQEDCGEGSSCVNNVCRQNCAADNDCALNEKCLKGNCILTCRVDNDCFLGHICLHNMCMFGCHSDDDCSATESCRENKCLNPCLETSCGPNAACSVANQRAVCSCRAGFVPNPTANVACVRAPAPPCKENRDCSSGTVCMSGVCHPVCASDSGCLTNEKCDLKTRICKAVCRKDDDCRSGELCQDFICTVGCRSDFDCSEDKACVNSKCIDLCDSPTACGTNADCSIKNHQKVCKCSLNLIGDPEISCKHPAILCSSNKDCPKNNVCYGDKCTNKCSTDSHCLSDERCLDGICKTVCNSDTKCRRGEICENRVCELGCRSDIVCPKNQACINKQCRDPCEAATTCGSCAECIVVNHGVQCSCPQSYIGNPLVACSKPPTRCNSSCTCDKSTGYCLEGCSVNKECPCGQVCLKGFCSATCSATNPCQTGQICIDGICTNGCFRDGDCPNDQSCKENVCRNPCDIGHSPCGMNAECRVSDHRAVCLCPAGTRGDPTRSCKPFSCLKDEDCEGGKSCGQDNICRNPCLQGRPCGLNAQCKAENRRALCSCPPGFHGNPLVVCKPGSGDTCSRKPCGQNTRCKDIAGGYECSCAPGCSGDPYRGCVCQDRRVDDRCANVKCGMNAICKPSGNTYQCLCPPEYPLGDPKNRCIKQGDCRTQGCGVNAVCTEIKLDEFECKCPPGTKGKPNVHCKPVVGCLDDSDCPEHQSCQNQNCQDPCVTANPCHGEEQCQVHDHQPACVKVCQCQKDADCRQNFICDGCHCVPSAQEPVVYEGCDHCPPGVPCNPLTGACIKEESTKPQCSSDSQCSDTESCINRQCVNPCLVSSPCGNNAECRPDNHKVTCHCPEGLAGNPYTNCYKTLDTSPECKSDSECASQLACINQRCQNPCVTSNPCSSTAECTAMQHRPTCSCPQGWAGDPQSHCYKPECRADSDCLYDKACISGNCLSPCRETSCGRGAECRAVAHSAQCVCPQGTQGDPHVSCVTVVCQYNEDCADHEACDRLNRVCRPVCESDVCGTRATCIARSHQHKCICEPGTQGDPYVECTVDYRAHAECTQDSDCPSKTGCINRKCQDPCSLPAVCAFDQECRVQDTLPMRTVLCVCPPDTIASIDGHCRPIVKTTEECQSDSECRDPERCVRGSCVEACRIDPCGLNALCQSTRHQSVCTCSRGYIGNPHIECNPDHGVSVPPFQPVPECTHNDECPANKRCKNQICVNPCTHDSPCAPGAFCHTDDHQPICRCPAGFQGNPSTQCIPPAESTVSCSSNSDCTPREACVNKLCVSPCNCGPNAECKVNNHFPICYCKPGYSGNPQIGCVKVGCESESQCSDDKICYNSECINPCILGDACGINAECFGAKHAAQCKCNIGYRGNPLIRCERMECSVDSDCSQDRLCRDHRCINPCEDQINPPCAHNAICYVRNHQASCRCPDWMPLGDPLSYCQRVPPVSIPTVECENDVDCPNQEACINNKCLNPCVELSPCTPSSMCSVFDSTPVRTMVCTCSEGWVPDNDGECKPVIVPSPPGCVSDSECSHNETCINRMCRNPCNCGPNAECLIMNHRPICSCISGYNGNPNIGCRAVGCRIDSECESGKACINGNCINPCVVEDPCGPNAECYPVGTRPECRCLSGYRGNPYDRCLVVGCRSNSDCPNDRACINAQCINPCIYDQPCAARAECFVQNHLPLCRCPPEYEGNPYTSCRPKVEPECRVDGDCPSFYACFNQQCKDPCQEVEPCQKPAQCEAIKTLPVRTMICECPPGYISSGSGVCKATPAVVAIGECISDSDCPSDRACINAICKNPCNCGPNADCRVRDHKPVCSCLPGYDGNAEIECQKAGCRSNTDCPSQQACLNRECVPACSPDGSSCGTGAICYGSHHTALCECPPGLTGDPHIGCVHVECETNSDCPSDKACINSRCKSPCEDSDPCLPPGECTVFNHVVDCKCPPGFIGDTRKGCSPVEVKCKEDHDCPKQTACINQECVNPCNATQPCGTNSECKVFDTYPVKTMICECLPGYYGNAAVECVPVSECPADKGFVRNEDGECVCPPGTGLNLNDECERCPPEKGLKVDEKGRCVCDLEKGLIVDERGNCICRTDLGYHLDINGNCLPVGPGCTSDDDCLDSQYCNSKTKTCEDPCAEKVCGINAFCNTTSHIPVCQCIKGNIGDPDVICKPPVTAKTDFPQPEMIVSCLSDGVQVEIHIEEKGFNGVLYVKGHSKDEKCRRVLSVPNDSPVRTEIFKVNFGTCGLIHVNGQASFVLVIQKHPMLVTFKTQAYHIKCVYTTGEQNVTLGFNVSMLTTAGTIANTGPPPTCFMRIVTHSGQEINSAEIGDNLMLQVEVQPSTIYGGFARSCVAKTMEDTVENEYEVTDENGCATDPSIFGEWDYNPETQSLMANFNAFKFPSSDNIRFQCNIRVCFGKCQPVNCRGYNAFGRRRREIRDSMKNMTGVNIAESIPEGQLREEITIQSNAILTFERREERFIDPREGRLSPEVQQIDDICVSMIGFIIALVITALLALVAVAVAVSCWLIAYRRRPKVDGPLPHPPDFPNPLFTTPDPLAEPSPDYLS